MDGRHLARALADPDYVTTLDARGWNALIAMARAERLDGTLAWRLKGMDVPEAAREVLDNALVNAEANRVQALWEAEMARRVLAPLGIPVILLKGTAFAAAGLDAGSGRLIGDLDILVPRDRLNEAEAALLGAGWSWVKDDPYDQAYYRQHMHELPPLIHDGREKMIDVHHTILPLTAGPTPDAAALVADSVALAPTPFMSSEVETPDSSLSTTLETNGSRLSGLRILSPEDMIIHAIAHLLADGDLQGGLRNLWDIDRLIREFAEMPGFWPRLLARARHHQLAKSTSRALRLAAHIFDTPVDTHFAWHGRRGDVFYMGRLLARDDWGRESRKLLGFAFYLRSHWLRMPPLKLARHLWTKWRMGHRG